MFSKARKHVTYANVALTLALVFVMTGGAYAASKYLITSTKQIKPSVLAQLKGKTGKAGANGANGAQGPAGPAGAKGANGANGAQGPAGEKGANGAPGAAGEKGPAGEKGANGAQGPAGATGPKGSTGPAGPEGVCSTSNCVLPKGVTETGEWDIAGTSAALHEHKTTTISFPIPLSVPPLFENEGTLNLIHIGEKPTTGPCAGGTAAAPKAAEGNLCLFEGEVAQIHKGGLLLANAVDASGQSEPGLTGAMLVFVTTVASGEVSSEGTWAVTG